jgi:hypothetical protein
MDTTETMLKELTEAAGVSGYENEIQDSPVLFSNSSGRFNNFSHSWIRLSRDT